MSEEKFLMRAIDISRILGVHDRTITRWSLKGLIVRKDVGKYCLLSVFQYYKQQLIKDIESLKHKIEETTKQSEKNSLQLDKLKASIKIIESNASIREHELEELKDSLVNARNARYAYTDMCIDIKRKSLELPRLVSDELSTLSEPNEINLLLQSEINKLLNQLAA